MKKEFFIGLILGFVFLGSLVWADTNGIWHRAEDIQGGTFAGDEGVATSNFIFMNLVDFQDDIVVQGKVADADDATYYMDLNQNTKMENLSVNVIESGTSGNVIIQLG